MDKIDLLTVITSPARKVYLERLFHSLLPYDNDNRINKHILIFNGEFDEVECQTLACERSKLLFTPHRMSIGQILNTFKSEIESPLVMKLDDDATLLSPNFFDHLFAIVNLNPGAVFSPFPVGLINNLGGVQSNNRSVIYNESLDSYYTLRYVNHIGGFARVSPSEIYKQIHFSDNHNEDGEFSNFCNKMNIPMFYLENDLVVQHQESTLGQHRRYGEGYFGKRF